MFRIGIPQDYMGTSCNGEAEFAEHFLRECPAHGRIRHTIFGADELQFNCSASYLLAAILLYINKSGIFRHTRELNRMAFHFDVL